MSKHNLFNRPSDPRKRLKHPQNKSLKGNKMDKVAQNNAIDSFVAESVSMTKDVLNKKLSDSNPNTAEAVKELLDSKVGSSLIALFFETALHLLDGNEKAKELADNYHSYATNALVDHAKDLKSDPKYLASHVDM